MHCYLRALFYALETLEVEKKMSHTKTAVRITQACHCLHFSCTPERGLKLFKFSPAKSLTDECHFTRTGCR